MSQRLISEGREQNWQVMNCVCFPSPWALALMILVDVEINMHILSMTIVQINMYIANMNIVKNKYLYCKNVK